MIGTGNYTISWCKSVSVNELVATYRSVMIAEANQEFRLFRANSYSQSDGKERENYQKELIKIVNNGRNE